MIAAARRRRASLPSWPERWRAGSTGASTAAGPGRAGALRAWADGRRGWTRWSKRLRAGRRPYMRAGRLLRWPAGGCGRSACSSCALLGAGSSGARGRRGLGGAGRDPGQRRAHPRAGDLRRDRRLRRLPRWSPSSSTTARSRSAQPGYAGLPASPSRRPSTSKTPATPTPTCWSPVGAARRRRSASLAARRDRPRLGPGRLRARPAQRSPSSCSSTCPPASTPASQASLLLGATAVLEDGFYAELAAAAG